MFPLKNLQLIYSQNNCRDFKIIWNEYEVFENSGLRSLNHNYTFIVSFSQNVLFKKDIFCEQKKNIALQGVLWTFISSLNYNIRNMWTHKVKFIFRLRLKIVKCFNKGYLEISLALWISVCDYTRWRLLFGNSNCKKTEKFPANNKVIELETEWIVFHTEWNIMKRDY